MAVVVPSLVRLSLEAIAQKIEVYADLDGVAEELLIDMFAVSVLSWRSC